jgi:methyl-accepting chemotaxis protein
MNRIDGIGKDFYETLFETEPSLKVLFNEGADIQGKKFMTLIGTVVTKLHLGDEPDEMILSLGKRHVAYGVKDDYYPRFGKVLLNTFEKHMGDQWTLELKEAWALAFQHMADLMIKASHRSA